MYMQRQNDQVAMFRSQIYTAINKENKQSFYTNSSFKTRIVKNNNSTLTIHEKTKVLPKQNLSFNIKLPKARGVSLE